MNDFVMDFVSAVSDLKEGKKEKFGNLIGRFMKKKNQDELEWEMFSLYLHKLKKAKKRGRYRVEQNYIKVCRTQGLRPWGFLTEDEIERERYSGYGY